MAAGAGVDAIDGFCRYPDVRPASLSYDGGLGLRYWISAANSPNYVTLMIFCICTVRELAGTKLGTAERIGMQGRYATPERPD